MIFYRFAFYQISEYMKLFHRELGEGKAIIILHGLFGSSDNWLTIAKHLSENYKIYLLDQRNHGQSEWSDEWNYAVMAEDLKAFIQDSKIENPIIIGHSMGGKVAMLFASKYPDLLEKLLVVDIAPKYYPIHHDWIINGLKAIDIQTIKSRREADKQLSSYIEELGVRQFLLKNLYRTPEKKFAWRMNLSVIDKNIGNVGEVLPEESLFEKETLFIRGANSNYIKDSDFDLVQKHFPTANIETVENAGHWVHAEKPAETISLFIEFFEG